MAAIDAGLDAGASFDFGQHLERFGTRMDAALRAVANAMYRPPAQPFVFRPNATGKSGSSGDLVLDLGGPQSGRYWDVLGLTVGGRLWSSTVAGTALVVVSSTPPANAAGTPLGFVIDEYTALPKVVAGYSRDVIRVDPPNHLFIVVATPTATTEYNAVASVEQFETGPRVQTAAT